MNDINVALIDWDQMIAGFTEEIAGELNDAIHSGDYDTASSISQNFLGEIIFSNPSTIPLSAIHRMAQPVSLAWSAFAGSYSTLRLWLPSRQADSFDGIYLPFIGHWADFKEKRNRTGDLPETMKWLNTGGLILALSPSFCKQHAGICRTHTFSFLIHCIACHKKESFALPTLWSWFNPLIDQENPDLSRLHADFTDTTECIRKLILEASRLGKGIMAVAEI